MSTQTTCWFLGRYWRGKQTHPTETKGGTHLHVQYIISSFHPTISPSFFCTISHKSVYVRTVVCLCYLDNRQPHVLGSGEAVQHQQRRRSAPWRPTAGITEAVTSIVGVTDHEAEPATPVPAEDTSSITWIIIYYHRKHNVYNSSIIPCLSFHTVNKTWFAAVLQRLSLQMFL